MMLHDPSVAELRKKIYKYWIHNIFGSGSLAVKGLGVSEYTSFFSFLFFLFFSTQSHSDTEQRFITMGGGDWSAVSFIYAAQYMVKMNMEFKSLNEAVLIHGLRNEGSKNKASLQNCRAAKQKITRHWWVNGMRQLQRVAFSCMSWPHPLCVSQR